MATWPGKSGRYTAAESEAPAARYTAYTDVSVNVSVLGQV